MIQKGFIFHQEGVSAILVIVGAVLVLSVSAFLLLRPASKNQENPPSKSIQSESKNPESPQTSQDSNEPPLKLKSIGVNLDYYDPKTGKAGDFKFTKVKLQFNRLFMGYGFFIPASSASPDKKNPQPTFILPLGTPVRSIVDGVVANIATVWSGDYSIQVTKSGQLERWVYETEHVLNPKVKVGDKVKAGQIIAEVSNFDKGAPEGFGAVEIGILHGGGEGPPEHVCPFAYLDDSIKDETFTKLRDFFKSWEEYLSDQTLYEESDTPGCLTQYPIEG